MTAVSEERDAPVAARTEADIIKDEDTKTASDNDTTEPERPVRRKLQETRITSDGNPSVPKNEVDDDRGRLKKRSHDDLQTEEEIAEPQSEGGHRRKRSRDAKDDGDNRQSTPEPTRNQDDAPSSVLSPKKKRSLDQLQEDGRNAPSEEKPSAEESGKTPAEGERETKRHRDASKERQTTIESVAATEKSSLPSAFLNTSSVSPFASLGPKSSEAEAPKTKTTSSSAFAASGLASFAGQEQSPFGTLGKPATTPSVFSKPTATSEEKSAGSGFSATSSASPFGNTGASGFAALGSGFGGGFGSGGGFGGSTGGKLSSFASATGSGFGSSTAKPFGTEKDADKEDEEEGEGSALPAGFEKEKEDERFYEQQIETGEEEEHTYFSCKAKLFHFTNKEWKERGVGTFKINVKEPPSDAKDDSDDNNKKSARMIMRADGVLRVMLNSPIFKGMPVGDVSGEEPKGKQLNLASVEDGKTVPLLLRVGNAESAKELYHVIIDLQNQL